MSVTSTPTSATTQKEVNTLTIIKLCRNDSRTINIELTDFRGNSIYWDRTASGDWSGSWEARPDLGPELVDALVNAGLTPTGIHIGDDEAYAAAKVSNIEAAAQCLRESGFAVQVKI